MRTMINSFNVIRTCDESCSNRTGIAFVNYLWLATFNRLHSTKDIRRRQVTFNETRICNQAGDQAINEAMNQSGTGAMNEINHITEINSVNQSTNHAIIQPFTHINDIKSTQRSKQLDERNLTLADDFKLSLFCRSIRTPCCVPRAPRCTTM